MITDNVCEDYCQNCWEELNLCLCSDREEEVCDVFTEVEPMPGTYPDDPMVGSEWVKTKKKKKVTV